MDDIRAMEVNLFDSSTIPISLLWSCIKGQVHKMNDGVFSFEENEMNEDDRENMACELWLKKSILHDIVNQIIILKYFTDVKVSKHQYISSMIDEQGIRIVFRDAIKLIAKIQPQLGSELQRCNAVGDVSLYSLVQLMKSFVSETKVIHKLR